MVYEWKKVELYGANNDGNPVRYNIADGVSVSKGAVLYLTDPFTASGAALGSKAVAGVASEEKAAGNGITSIAVWTDGKFLATASGAVTVGSPIIMDGITANTIKVPATVILASGAITIGYACETGAAKEEINVRLRL